MLSPPPPSGRWDRSSLSGGCAPCCAKRRRWRDCNMPSSWPRDDSRPAGRWCTACRSCGSLGPGPATGSAPARQHGKACITRRNVFILLTCWSFPMSIKSLMCWAGSSLLTFILLSQVCQAPGIFTSWIPQNTHVLIKCTSANVHAKAFGVARKVLHKSCFSQLKCSLRHIFFKWVMNGVI